MKKIIYAILFCFPLQMISQKSTDDLNLADKLLEVNEDNILINADYHNWGSSIVKGEDGKYHLFYAQMSEEIGFSSWLTDGIVSHAVADSLCGPYVHKEVVLEGRGAGFWDAHTAHNPRIKFFDGKYYLYYMSTNTGGRTLTESEWEQARHGGITNEFRALVRMNQRIGVAVSESVNGPWERFNTPLVEPSGPIAQITCNPAVTQRPDGGYIMIIRGDKPDVEYANGKWPSQNELIRSQAIALSDSPMGPWVIQPKLAVGNLNSEDPAIWYDATRERYYGIYHAFGYMGMITSEDGLSWEKAKHYKVLDKAIQKADGTEILAGRLERPFIYMEDGKAKVLTVAVLEKNGNSYSLFIPLD
ncbi:glycoside hydrolase family protein [Saccharicrinis aurantiacus]|uniref:glycoside hydrolase family protein n=1 Tax=Saccharicrinis aurantiacus TaxID=1849719 RepID=UPI002490F1A1|nr:glycoside hydrolase family protein [Saccharicrinis aurantiacus]